MLTREVLAGRKLINGTSISARMRSAAAKIEDVTPTFKAIEKFLTKYRHGMVAKRRKEAIELVLENGRALLAEHPANHNAAVSGCALQYDLMDAKYVEIGSIRVPGAAGLGGFDLQDIFISVAAFNLLFEKYLGEEGDFPDYFFATIDPENYETQHEKFKRVGLIPWKSPPQELKDAKKRTVSLGSDNPVYYVFDESFLPNTALFLKELHSGTYCPSRRSRANNSVIEKLDLDLDFFVFRRQLEWIEEISKEAKFSISDEIEASK
ncbi:hypothetical protein [Aliiroseovarius sp. 2305UL8-7]|uniref:hypothetical protein n=1 Tax=Aliiroseovarius conchicola TaxID=3121637 RepID=UPI0035272C6C